jgi:hypothetical protein
MAQDTPAELANAIVDVLAGSAADAAVHALFADDLAAVSQRRLLRNQTLTLRALQAYGQSLNPSVRDVVSPRLTGFSPIFAPRACTCIEYVR